MLLKNEQVETRGATLTTKKQDGSTIIEAKVGEIKGAIWYRVDGQPNKFDLIVYLPEPNKFAPQSKREFYAGTFEANTAPLSEAYKLLSSSGFRSVALTPDLLVLKPKQS